MGCGSGNGEVDEGKKLVKEVLGQRSERGTSSDGGHDDGDFSDLVEVETVEEEDVKVKEKEDEGASGAKRRKGKGRA